jgi:K+-transporting ATPase KdpF subunit
LASRDVLAGHRWYGAVFVVPESVRENIKVEVTQMIYVTAVIAVFLFIYLIVALVRPEWF